MSARHTRLALFLLLAATSAHGQTWTEGRDYYAVIPAQHTSAGPGKIEVTEVFSYGCPYCAQFNPLVQQFKRSLPTNAQLVLLPDSFNPAEDWPMFQRAACTAQALGILERTHEAMFNAVWSSGELAISDLQTHRLKSVLPTIEDAARFYNRIAGVAVEKFIVASQSFSVDAQMRADDALVKVYHVDSTPTLIVNGKYRITGQSAGGMKQMIEIASWLVARESQLTHR